MRLKCCSVFFGSGFKVSDFLAELDNVSAFNFLPIIGSGCVTIGGT